MRGLEEFTLGVRRGPLGFNLLRSSSRSANRPFVDPLAGLLRWLLSISLGVCALFAFEDIILRCRPRRPGPFCLQAVSLAVAGARRVPRERLHKADLTSIFILLSHLLRSLLIL